MKTIGFRCSVVPLAVLEDTPFSRGIICTRPREARVSVFFVKARVSSTLLHQYQAIQVRRCSDADREDGSVAFDPASRTWISVVSPRSNQDELYSAPEHVERAISTVLGVRLARC